MRFQWPPSIDWGSVLNFMNFLLASAMVIMTLVEFALPPPIYDSFPSDQRFKDLPSIDDVFSKISPNGASEAAIHRVMDSPILLLVSLYYFGCIYFRFSSWSWVMTGAAYSALTIYTIVHSAAANIFDWKYLPTRGAGIAMQITGMALLSSVVITLIQARRKRLKFRLQSTREGTDPTPGSETALIAWNLIFNFVLLFVCLVMWTAGSYQSFVFIRYPTEVSYLCQLFSSVRCIDCPDSTKASFDRCVANRTTMGCTSDVWHPGFCIFNLNVGYFTFIKMFAYTGGLYFFLGKFINAVSHYIVIIVDVLRTWWRRGEAHTSLYVNSVLQSIGSRNSNHSTAPSFYIDLDVNGSSSSTDSDGSSYLLEPIGNDDEDDDELLNVDHAGPSTCTSGVEPAPTDLCDMSASPPPGPLMA